ncbi:MAG: insulinase family protein [Gammaproteobacteria bacterium]|nr:insulinase family protein [Gammaproteobacteria bacterium]MDH5303121.1 insulinase family protein [Gammaproteobacteria bacterium]MDH5322157.1 insulinase family protein [Gammaproteobacteria bacterium]
MFRIALTLVACAATACLAACEKTPHSADTTAVDVLPESITLVESVSKSSSQDLTVPYRKYEMDNGLTVILHEDHSDPLVHVDITYHVGSAREEVGKSGFAHFFEHMLFQGSENVADEEHFRIISESGGTLNGSTNSDRTNYFETVPANQLEKVLWLEADRMGYFLDSVTQEKFEVQRETVKNERGQSVDNQPYGRLLERVGEALYPVGHGYSWSTIGYIEDLNRVDVDDLKRFFLRWYGPNNATLTIGGHFDAAQALAWVAKYFGPIPRGPAVDAPAKPAITLDADRYISMQDNVALPLLYVAWPTVSLYHADEAPLDVLMFIIGQGDTSLLYKNLVKSGLSVQAGAGHSCEELACTFTMYALPNPAMGKSLADLEKIARESLLEFEQRGVLPDDLERVKMNIVSGKIYALESVAGKVMQLAANETFTGNPNFTAADIARYENVTAGDVMRVYERYIKDKPAVIMSVVPMGQPELIAGPDTWSRPTRELPDYDAIDSAPLEVRRGQDDFDRSVMPPAGENPAVILPKIWRDSLKNGVDVLGALNAETPTVAVQLRIDAGQRHESLEQLGLAALTAAMMNESTLDSTNEEISNELQKLGSTVQFSSGNDNTVLSIRSLTENLDATLAIAAERLLRPKFDAHDFTRVKDQILQSIRQSKVDAGVMADVAYQMVLYGKGNSFAYLNLGTEESVAGLELDDVRLFYKTHYAPRAGSIIVVSDVDQAALMKKLSVFENWQGVVAPTPRLAEFPDIDKTRIYLVDKPGAAQSEIRIGRRALKFDATGEYYRATLMNFALGGAFNSRINLNLREDKGYSYGAWSGFSGNKEYGSYTAQAGVRTDATVDSIVQFENEIRGYAESGISESELSFTRKAIGQSDARAYETPSQKLAFLGQILEYDLDENFVNAQNEILAGIGKDQINELAKRLLQIDQMIIVVVGDKQSILPGLQTLGYEIQEIGVNGELIES